VIWAKTPKLKKACY